VNSDTVAESLALKPSFTIRAHAQTVTAIQATSFGGSGNGRIYSCSWDHSLKEWDMEKQDCVASFASSKVATSLHFSEPAGLVATSHPDGRVRLWDPRKRDEALAVAAMTSTTAAQVGVFGSSSRDKEVHWVSQVRFHPTSATIFASSDYDGVVKIWDTRAPLVPLGKSQAHEGKALCVDWREKTSDGDNTGEVDVLSGGSDCLVRATTLH
jgi:ribosome biogenesis protein